MKYTFKQYQAQFPNDDACLNAIMQKRYGNTECCPICGIVGKLTRIQGRRAFACKEGCHIYPCVDTPFEHSSTPLTLWFHAMYLMTATRNGVSAKELERQLGVTYKCAWRIGHELRKLMAADENSTPPMSGHIEVDETYVGGRSKGMRGRGAKGKTIVFGALERKGNIKATIVPDVTRQTLEAVIEADVVSGSTISSDELASYKELPRLGYKHGTVQHGTKQYVNGIHHVNGVEGFWSHLHLQKYVGEFQFRYNNRKNPAEMFSRLMTFLVLPHSKAA